MVLLLLAAAWLAGCQDVIEVDLGDGAPARLVVEGGVVHGEPVQTIRLSTTSPYFDADVSPPVPGASVTLADDAGATVALEEAEPGVYRGALRAEIGRTYTLDLEVGGERYRAVETLRAVAPIDSAFVVFEEGQGPDPEDGYRVRVSFRDPAGRGDAYRWQTVVDGRNRLPAEVRPIPSLLRDDELFDGLEVEAYSPNPEVAFQPGETVTVRQSSLTSQALTFFELVLQQAAGRPGPFEVPPADIRGNVANLTDPARPAFGYFWVRDVSVAVLEVP